MPLTGPKFTPVAATWPTVVKTGVFSEPWSLDTHFSRVDYRDVAEVAAIALTEQRLMFGTYELCAEGDLNRKDVAALMGEVLRKKVEAAKLTPVNGAGTSKSSSDGKQVSPIERMFQWYDNHGLLGNPLVLSAILGREPRTLRAYFEELAAEPGGKVDS